MAVFVGDAEVGAAFSGLAFDHMIFTGGTSIAKHVMKAASENLVPLTLELEENLQLLWARMQK